MYEGYRIHMEEIQGLDKRLKQIDRKSKLEINTKSGRTTHNLVWIDFSHDSYFIITFLVLLGIVLILHSLRVDY